MPVQPHADAMGLCWRVVRSVKAAAEASGRKICFVGTSLNTYLEAADKVGRAPIDPKDILNPQDLQHYDPNQVRADAALPGRQWWRGLSGAVVRAQ